MPVQFARGSKLRDRSDLQTSHRRSPDWDHHYLHFGASQPAVPCAHRHGTVSSTRGRSSKTLVAGRAGHLPRGIDSSWMNKKANAYHLVIDEGPQTSPGDCRWDSGRQAAQKHKGLVLTTVLVRGLRPWSPLRFSGLRGSCGRSKAPILNKRLLRSDAIRTRTRFLRVMRPLRRPIARECCAQEAGRLLHLATAAHAVP